MTSFSMRSLQGGLNEVANSLLIAPPGTCILHLYKMATKVRGARTTPKLGKNLRLVFSHW